MEWLTVDRIQRSHRHRKVLAPTGMPGVNWCIYVDKNQLRKTVIPGGKVNIFNR
jgi:hypothetical protein